MLGTDWREALCSSEKRDYWNTFFFTKLMFSEAAPSNNSNFIIITVFSLIMLNADCIAKLKRDIKVTHFVLI